jgi:hypothetical protein
MQVAEKYGLAASVIYHELPSTATCQAFRRRIVIGDRLLSGLSSIARGESRRPKMIVANGRGGHQLIFRKTRPRVFNRRSFLSIRGAPVAFSELGPYLLG